MNINQETLAARNFLESPKKLNQRINLDFMHLQRLRKIRDQFGGGTLQREKVQGGQLPHSPVTRIIDQITDLEREIDRELLEYDALMRAVKQSIFCGSAGGVFGAGCFAAALLPFPVPCAAGFAELLGFSFFSVTLSPMGAAAIVGSVVSDTVGTVTVSLVGAAAVVSAVVGSVTVTDGSAACATGARLCSITGTVTAVARTSTAPTLAPMTAFRVLLSFRIVCKDSFFITLTYKYKVIIHHFS